MSEPRFSLSQASLLRHGILGYWTIFWLFNVLDKIIGGAHFLWVGRDRFAQFQKYFASAGLEAAWVANAGLMVAGALEVFALVFFAGAWWHLAQKRRDAAHSWCLMGIVLTMLTFTFFSIGDHLFGDRFELLEHTLFWFVTLLSWVLYHRIDDLPAPEHGWNRSEWWPGAAMAAVLIAATTLSIFSYNRDHFDRRTSALTAQKVGDHLYKVSFPFLGGSTVFEGTLAKFKSEHPDESIRHIYTVPKPLRLKKADALIFYIATEDAP